MQDIRKEKQKLYDERTALNKILREKGRWEEDLSILERSIKELSTTTLKPNYSERYGTDSDMIICISDFHLGQDVNSCMGTYNSFIAEQRLNNYLIQIDRIRQLNSCENAYVVLLGDLISGEIHVTTQLENRECLSDQVIKAGNLLSAFIYELSSKFHNVYINGVAGNHSRTSYKDQVLRNNRLDNIIPWYMKAKLEHLNNVFFVDNNNFDPTIATFKVRNEEVVAVHGDYDRFSESGLSKIILMLGYKPNIMLFGHLHHNSYDCISNVHMVRSGSFCGACDDYTVSKRISGNAAQAVCVIDDNGFKCMYPIGL